MDILYVDGNHPKSDVIVDKDRVYFPYSPVDEDGNDNKYQSSAIGSHGNLFIVIDPEKSVEDIYPEIYCSLDLGHLS